MTAEQEAGGWRQRVRSGLILAPLALAVVYLGPPVFPAVVLVAAALLAYEWHGLAEGGWRPASGLAMAALTLGVAFLPLVSGGLFLARLFADLLPVQNLSPAGPSGLSGGMAPLWGWLAGALGAALLAVLAARLAAARHPLWLGLGVFYLGLGCVALIWLRGDDSHGLRLIYWLIAVVWATDIGAYVCGKRLGRRRLAPRISPKKTWAGAVGGMLAAGCVGALGAWLWPAAETAFLIASSLGLSLAAQVGDLMESALKRRFQAKDSGTLIPGHGGLFDRMDSLLAGALVLTVAVLCLGSPLR